MLAIQQWSALLALHALPAFAVTLQDRAGRPQYPWLELPTGDILNMNKYKNMPKNPVYPRCPFYEKCGDECIGSNFHHGKQLATETRLMLESMDPKKTVAWGFGMQDDVSVDLTLACQYNFTVYTFDPSPWSEVHMNYLFDVVGQKVKTHPITSPMHAACQDCDAYWDDVTHTMAHPGKLNFVSKAIADEDGNVTLYEAPNEVLMQSPFSGSRVEGGRTLEVPAWTLRSLMQDMGTPKVDIMRIDVEGWETKILDQVADLPQEQLPRLVFAALYEYSLFTCREFDRTVCQKLKQDTIPVIRKMRSRGYQAVLYHHHDFIFMMDPPAVPAAAAAKEG